MDRHVEYLRRLFASTVRFEDGLGELAAHCSELAPTASWSQVSDLDLANESKSFRSWLERVAPNKVEAGHIRAYYFGLSDDGTTVHLDGSPDFDSDDDNCEWACSAEYRSNEGWTGSQALRIFAQLSQEEGGGVPILLYLLCLGCIGLLIKEHVPEVLCQPAGGMPAAVGFDEGDAYLVLDP